MPKVNFAHKEVVWAKYGDHPWWPAQVDRQMKPKNGDKVWVNFFNDQYGGWIKSGDCMRRFTNDSVDKYLVKKDNRDYDDICKAVRLANRARTSGDDVSGDENDDQNESSSEEETDLPSLKVGDEKRGSEEEEEVGHMNGDSDHDDDDREYSSSRARKKTIARTLGDRKPHKKKPERTIDDDDDLPVPMSKRDVERGLARAKDKSSRTSLDLSALDDEPIPKKHNRASSSGSKKVLSDDDTNLDDLQISKRKDSSSVGRKDLRPIVLADDLSDDEHGDANIDVDTNRRKRNYDHNDDHHGDQERGDRRQSGIKASKKSHHKYADRVLPTQTKNPGDDLPIPKRIDSRRHLETPAEKEMEKSRSVDRRHVESKNREQPRASVDSEAENGRSTEMEARADGSEGEAGKADVLARVSAEITHGTKVKAEKAEAKAEAKVEPEMEVDTDMREILTVTFPKEVPIPDFEAVAEKDVMSEPRSASDVAGFATELKALDSNVESSEAECKSLRNEIFTLHASLEAKARELVAAEERRRKTWTLYREVLVNLTKAVVTVDILKSAGVGKVVVKIAKDGNAGSALAKRLKYLWRDVVEKAGGRKVLKNGTQPSPTKESSAGKAEKADTGRSTNENRLAVDAKLEGNAGRRNDRDHEAEAAGTDNDEVPIPRKDPSKRDQPLANVRSIDSLPIPMKKVRSSSTVRDDAPNEELVQPTRSQTQEPEHFRPREREIDRENKRERDVDRYKDRGRERKRERDVDRDRPQDLERGRNGDRTRERERDRDKDREPLAEDGQNQERELEVERDRDRDRDRDREWNRDRARDRERDQNRERERPKPKKPAKKDTPKRPMPKNRGSMYVREDRGSNSPRSEFAKLVVERFATLFDGTRKGKDEEAEKSFVPLEAKEAVRLAEDVEKAIRSMNLPRDEYNDKARVLFLNLNRNVRLRSQVVKGEMTCERLVRLTSDEMKTDVQLAEKRKIEANNMHWSQTSISATPTDLFQCPQCKKRETTYYEMQTRSADEPATAFISCLNPACLHRWKEG